VAFLESYDNDIKALKREILRMCWFMRGGITYDQLMASSNIEREIISEIIKSNLETAKESGMPFW
jgi:hypothetical protein